MLKNTFFFERNKLKYGCKALRVVNRMSFDQLWNNVLAKIRDSLEPVMYDMWFKETKVHSIENGTINVIVPFILHKTYLKGKYNERLEEIIFDITGTN